MVEPKIHPPPPPSTPREAPWRQIEELIDGLKAVAQKLDVFISLYTGIPITPPSPPPAPPAIPAPPELPPLPPLPEISVDGRLDALVDYTRIPLEWGKATGGSKNKLICLGKNWADSIWAGYQLAIVDGTGAEQVRRIKTNTRDSITPQTDFDINPDNTSVFVIRTALAIVANKPALTTGQKDVTAAGTAEQLPDVKIPDGFEATVTAKHGNTGRIYIGGTKAEAEAHTISLGRDDVFHEFLTNLNAIWIDADNNGEGVDYEVPQ